MKAKDWEEALPYLLDMKDHVAIAMRFAQGRSESDLESDLMYRFAVLHAIQIIGEAAAKTPDFVRELTLDIPWPLIVKFRHIVVHDYGRVELSIVYSILRDELPGLENALDALITTVRGRFQTGPNPAR